MRRAGLHRDFRRLAAPESLQQPRHLRLGLRRSSAPRWPRGRECRPARPRSRTDRAGEPSSPAFHEILRLVYDKAKKILNHGEGWTVGQFDRNRFRFPTRALPFDFALNRRDRPLGGLPPVGAVQGRQERGLPKLRFPTVTIQIDPLPRRAFRPGDVIGCWPRRPEG